MVRNDPVDQHEYAPDTSFDGGDLDCGNGLLLLIRKHIDPLANGQLMEVISTDISVEEDLPAWCRLTKNDLVSWTKRGNRRSFLICKGAFNKPAFDRSRTFGSSDANKNAHSSHSSSTFNRAIVPVTIPNKLPQPAPAKRIKPGAVMGIGSWPRPKWLLRCLHDRLSAKISDQEFQSTANDAVRLAVTAQLRAGADVITDGEQRRDNYSSFVGAILDNCQLIPLTDLLAMVDDPKTFAAEMDALDVPTEMVRHPVVFGELGRSRPLALHETEFLSTLTDKPLKVSLPGPYLLTRTMWLECIADKAYNSREQLADDIVRVLREELHFLLAAGVSLVQFDEPVLTEVVFSNQGTNRSFMCGALSERQDTDHELDFALNLINRVVSDSPRDRTALHVCRGNWTPDESVALSGAYWPLLPVLTKVEVGTLFLEFCTPRAGDLEVIKALPSTVRLGIGVVNPKNPEIEDVQSILRRIDKAAHLVGLERLLFTPDCGFATFADNPVSSSAIAEAKLAAVVRAAST